MEITGDISTQQQILLPPWAMIIVVL